jgi:hypothetical protein
MNMTGFVAVLCGCFEVRKLRNFFGTLRLEGCGKSLFSGSEIHLENMSCVLHLRQID